MRCSNLEDNVKKRNCNSAPFPHKAFLNAMPSAFLEKKNSLVEMTDLFFSLETKIAKVHMSLILGFWRLKTIFQMACHG